MPYISTQVLSHPSRFLLPKLVGLIIPDTALICYSKETASSLFHATELGGTLNLSLHFISKDN